MSQPDNPSLAMAVAAKKKLEPLGWTCKGRAWMHRGRSDITAGPLTIGTRTWQNLDVLLAEVTASRGEETLIMTWADGECVRQDYSLWDTAQTPGYADSRPWNKLTFDPHELSDVELVKYLAGMPVVWWNKLAGAETHAVISGHKIQVERTYDNRGVESVTDRIVKFNDAADGGFRAFRISALMKVGK